MSKINVTRTVDVEHWTLLRIVKYVESLGLELKDVTISKATIPCYDNEYQVIAIEYKELETDEEYVKRIEQNAAFKQSAIDREKAEYERLRKKYG